MSRMPVIPFATSNGIRTSLGPGRIRADAGDVGVHVPQAGDEEFPAGVDDLRAFGT